MSSKIEGSDGAVRLDFQDRVFIGTIVMVSVIVVAFAIMSYFSIQDSMFFCEKYCECHGTKTFSYSLGSCKCLGVSGAGLNLLNFTVNKTTEKNKMG